MGIASNWLSCFFSPSYSKPPQNDKHRWRFIKSFRQKNSSAAAAVATAEATNIKYDNNNAKSSMYVNPDEKAKAVAAATTAAAEAAVAPTGAAAAVVRVVNRSSCCASESVDIASSLKLNMETAAIMIQSAYRGHLARRALRALKSLVKIQAMVRGHIERKRAAEVLLRLQTLVRAQLRARSGQIRITPSSHSSCKSSHVHHAGPSTPANYERAFLSKSRKYEPSMVKINGTKSSRTLNNHEKLYLGRNWSDLRMAEKIRPQKVRSTRVAPTFEENGTKSTLNNHEKLYLGRNWSDLRMAEKIRPQKARSTRVAPTFEENGTKSSRRTLDNHENLYLDRSRSDLRMADNISARKVRPTRLAPTYIRRKK